MSKQARTITLGILICAVGAIVQAQTLCPGYNPNNNNNLACELATAFRASGANFKLGTASVSATLGTQLANFPTATAVSGSGFVFGKGAADSPDSLGTILTQRGESLGKRHFFVSFSYQKFGFGSTDGIGLKHFNTIAQQVLPGLGSAYTVSDNGIQLNVDEFTALGAVGLTNRIDLTVVVPISTVSLHTQSNPHLYFADTNNNATSNSNQTPLDFPGTATGLGDVVLGVKANLLRAENGTSIAFGSQFRIPTGDETNFLGTGAYGVKPYFIVSRRLKRFTPNANVGYQWNGVSSLYFDPKTGSHSNLPSSFGYSAGVDFRVRPRFTLVGEFLGQYVINGPRIVKSSVNVPGAGSVSAITSQDANGNMLTSSYGMNNAGFGFKMNPYRSLLISASAMFKLDNGGLRAKWVPLMGASYRF